MALGTSGGDAGQKDRSWIWLCAMLFGCGGSGESSELTGQGTLQPGGGMHVSPSPGAAAGGGPPRANDPAGSPATGGTTAGAAGLSAAGTAAPPRNASGEGGSSAAGASAAAGSSGSMSAAGSGGSAAAGTSGSADPPTTYPELAAAQIGTPMQIARGFRLAESPIWNPCTKRLMFADVMGASGKGAIHALEPDGSKTDIMTNTGNTNGFTYDIDGSLILAQMNGHVARRSSSGDVKTLEPASARLHTPDDVVVRSDGTIYFTDGDFCPVGNLLGFGSSLPVFMLKPGASELVDLGHVGGPNGIELSPDEKTLYVAAFGAGTISAFDVAPDGTAQKRAGTLVSGLPNPDSLCLDAAGNLYVGVSSGLRVLRANGREVKHVRIDAPAGECTTSGVTNCTFGGDDGKTMYLTTWTTIWKIDNMPIPGLDWVVNQKRAVCQ